MKAVIVEYKHFCLCDCEEKKNWRNNLETRKMGVAEWEQEIFQENRHPGLNVHLLFSSQFMEESMFYFFFSTKHEKDKTHFLFLQS